ncbi:MAG TPA: ribosome-associated translation inhibitor RaiA [Jatrophihabitantaceae bacterium]|nr:ribosome-associated translation inhibitor RaiA [Jatrophihabitantaceae bacterium]
MGTAVGMEIVVRGRNVVVPDHYRQHVADKIAKVERYDQKIIRTDVELQHERNPRQTGRCQHVEITCRTRGPVVRSEACAEDFYKALDLAAERLERRFRQAADRRRVHHGRRTPPSIAAVAVDNTVLITDDDIEDVDTESDDGPGRVVREKEHPAKPMTVDQALFEMELVGHDFYLFSDVESGRPSVVYRRHAYDYGLIRLTV